MNVGGDSRAFEYACRAGNMLHIVELTLLLHSFVNGVSSRVMRLVMSLFGSCKFCLMTLTDSRAI